MSEEAVKQFVFIEPMKAIRARELPVGNWMYELKFAGYRALAFKAGKEVRLISRNRTNFDNDYPPAYRRLKIVECQKGDYRWRDRRA